MSLDTPRAKNLALMLLAMTQFVIVIDASIVNVALPSIGAALHFSRDNLSWVVNAYTLTFGGFLLLGGRLADLLGRRRMFMIGLVLFSLASLAGGLAQSEAWLIVARAVQGLGAAIVSPAALSIITTTFAEGAERNRALGVWGAVAGAGGAAGRAARRHPHERPELALGAVRQRPDRPDRGGARTAAAAREPRRRRHRRLRHPRRGDGHGRPRAARLRGRRRRQRRLGLDRHAAAARRRGRAAGRVRRDRAAHRATRCCRSRSSACARCAARTSSAC